MGTTPDLRLSSGLKISEMRSESKNFILKMTPSATQPSPSRIALWLLPWARQKNSVSTPSPAHPPVISQTLLPRTPLSRNSIVSSLFRQTLRSEKSSHLSFMPPLLWVSLGLMTMSIACAVKSAAFIRGHLSISISVPSTPKARRPSVLN